MENATKALLIAAAILIAILIISMGIVVYRQSAEQVGRADLSDTEKTAFNAKFEQYAGTTQTAENIKSLYKLTLNSNLNSDTKVAISGPVTLAATATALPDLSSINSTKGYTVTLDFKDGNGYVKTITIKAKT